MNIEWQCCEVLKFVGRNSFMDVNGTFDNCVWCQYHDRLLDN